MIIRSSGGDPAFAPQQRLEGGSPKPITFWEFIQGAAVVAGLLVSLRQISRW
jgi:hypothetical protein